MFKRCLGLVTLGKGLLREEGGWFGVVAFSSYWGSGWAE